MLYLVIKTQNYIVLGQVEIRKLFTSLSVICKIENVRQRFLIGDYLQITINKNHI